MDTIDRNETTESISITTAQSTPEWSCQPGDEVYGSDDQKLGKVKATFGNYLTVEEGRFLHHDVFVPTSAINNCEAGRVYLNVTKDEADQAGWDSPPTMQTQG